MSVTRNFGPLDQIKLTDKALMREVGLMIRERIVRRTRQGIGVDGPFKPYSAQYAAAKGRGLAGGKAKQRRARAAEAVLAREEAHGAGGAGSVARKLFDATRPYSGVVNLTVSGGMLNAIVLTRVEDDEVELGFSG